MINLNHIILLILIFSVVIAKQPTQKKAAVIDVKSVNLEQNKSVTFTIKYVSTAKPLMMNVEFTDPSQKFNPFKIDILKSGSIVQECHFKYINNLCVIQKPEKQVSVTVSCLEGQCQADLAFSQRTLVEASNQETYKGKLVVPGEIYKLSLRKFNTILEVYSEREQHQVLSEQIVVFSNVHAFSLQQTEQLDTNSAIFGLKHISSEQDRYIYLESNSKKNEILKISFKTHKGQLRDGITIVDFIQNYGKHSQASYNFVGSFHKNMQANVRIFSPRDLTGLPLGFIVKGKTSEQSEEQVIRELKFDQIEFGGHKFYDFSFGITKKIHSPFKFISFHILLPQGVEDKSIFFQMGVHDTDSFQISIFDHVYFGSLADEQLRFTVQPQVKLELASGDKQIQILTNAKQNYFSRTQSCSLHRGCNIQIQAKSQCKNCSFIFDLKDEDIQNHIIYYEVKEETIEGKVDMEEEIYFKYSMNSKSATQIIVNTMNVIIYANFQNYKRCKVPSAACHQFAINQQNPIVVRNKEEQPMELVIGVYGLDKTAFKVRFLNENNGLELKLGEKFSYVMDNLEQDLQLKFVIDRQSMEDNSNLHFNLIAPIHSLKLFVANLDGITIQSLQGYVSFQKERIHGNIFTIKIQKTPQYMKEYVHFTLLVSTANISVRLDTTITHYQRYLPKETKSFLVEYDASDINALNIYTQNLQKQKGMLTLTIRRAESGASDEAKTAITHKILRDYEFIDIDADLQQVDLCDQTNCELEITIKNEGSAEFEQSLTLMVELSIIALDDSIWSIFQINELSRNNHFYFVPRNKGKPINILFNTDDNLLYTSFRIFNTKKSINPQDWPFGHVEAEPSARISNSQEIVIPGNDTELAACWPTCVVLITINQVKQSEQKKGLDHSVIKSYKILASNSILELLEDTKLQFSLQNDEEKVLFIQAKNILKYQKLTFFTYYAFGRAKITMSVVSKEKEYKLNQDKDFIFEDLQTVIPNYVIIGLINRELLHEDSVLLKITIKAQTNLKMTLEYTSLLKDIYRLNMDELEVSTLRKGEQTWYEFIPERDFVLKLYRAKGFPIFKVFKCSQENYTQCLTNNKNIFQAGLEEFLKSEDKVKDNLEKQTRQIVQNQLLVNKTYPFQVFVEKSYELSDQQCEKCIYFLWVYCFDGDLELTVNIRTAMSEVQLKEMKVLNERADSRQHNKYLINILRNKDTIITVTILEGTAQVTIQDNIQTYFNTTLDSQQRNYKDFEINADDSEQEEQEQSEEKVGEIDIIGKMRQASSKHVSKHVHVTVTASQDGPVQYLISYSVGTSSLYLQDGIVVQKNMLPDIPHTFFYRNRNKKEHAYLTLSSQVQKDYEFINGKNSLKIKFYYYPDASNRKVKETFQPELPPQRNENYLGATISHVYELPSKFELYQVQIRTEYYLKVTASINHQQLVYLPLGYEYLIKLHATQMLNLVVDSPASEYLEVSIKKCDQSLPTLQYTNDAHQFKKGIFQAEVDIDSPHYRQFIKTKKNSKTLHLRLLGSDTEDSLLSISVGASSRQLKHKAIQYRPGNKGYIHYRTIQTDTVEVSFKPVTCDKVACNTTFHYYIVVSESIQQIYGELNCAGSFFVPQAEKILPKGKIDLIKVSEKHYDEKKGEYKHRVKMTDNQAYIGVKAVPNQGKKEDILYVPTEVRSFWSELGNASIGIMVMGGLVVALLLGVVALVSAKLARRGYKPISSDE